MSRYSIDDHRRRHLLDELRVAGSELPGVHPCLHQFANQVSVGLAKGVGGDLVLAQPLVATRLADVLAC